MKHLLFISSYLSRQSGSLCVSEKIAENLNQDGFDIKLVSRKKNKWLRLVDILFTLNFSRAPIWHMDVYSGQAFIITEISSLIGSILGRKMIFTLHGGMLPEFYASNANRIERVFKRATKITTPSHMLKNFFEPKGFEINYIPNAVDLQLFPLNRKHITQHSILWVRAFDLIYNPQLAIDVFQQVLRTFPDATLTMVGPDKGELESTKHWIQKFGLENKVTLTGPIPNTELYKYYQTHEVYMNTTSYESFGVSVMEAATSGIPIVTASVGELPFIWTDTEVKFTNEKDVSSFVAHIINLFQFPEQAKTLSKNAREKSLNYDWVKIKPQWMQLFNELYERKN
jgi:glycosyltransferase involved in cell wall biosynthesis